MMNSSKSKIALRIAVIGTIFLFLLVLLISILLIHAMSVLLIFAHEMPESDDQLMEEKYNKENREQKFRKDLVKKQFNVLNVFALIMLGDLYLGLMYKTQAMDEANTPLPLDGA